MSNRKGVSPEKVGVAHRPTPGQEEPVERKEALTGTDPPEGALCWPGHHLPRVSRPWPPSARMPTSTPLTKLSDCWTPSTVQPRRKPTGTGAG